ncbi:orotate phosphoribosyltransferase [Silanimonas sp.]|uniref:orotate phosphoribosyltransferase n=1 Tax=Silanimonas sp. TaxID=1929290 RepID=UPI0022C9E1D4|nr:orotate phosphoribosyltransferase [Silanimonas sp.]MCZ8114715.1 orotate phosphoribosyltransferase [Silanimonas sp.]
MSAYRQAFLDLSLRAEALRFGEFHLKSGRTSPYFFNAGQFNTGATLSGLADCYAEALLESGVAFDMLFGPAYKGIPLATALAMALAKRGRDVPVAFNRKEAKTHGEGGTLIGAPLKGRVLIVDDVITAGTAVRESVEIIRAAGGTPSGVLIALDRQERGAEGQRSAAQEASAALGVPVVSVARLDDLFTFVADRPELALHRERLLAYRAAYGSIDG